MIEIENQWLRATINPKGAELTSLVLKSADLEFMWGGDPAIWNKHSPVLFPIVGTLKNNQYSYRDRTYELTRHGFARDMEFDVSSHDGDTVTFALNSNHQTKEKFPFDFRFSIRYTMFDNQLRVTYEVSNTGSDTMYFSVGGHPAFKIPFIATERYQDYSLQFNEPEYAGRWPISSDGLITKTPEEMFRESQKLQLSKDLFSKDALVFKHLRSNQVSLSAQNSSHSLIMDFTGFPFLGIWAAKQADFVCIEPWCGIADSVDSTGKLEEKEGIERLDAGAVFERTWKVSFQ